MPDWLQILLTIILTLAIITGVVLIGMKIYRNLSKPGTCNFIAYSPGTNTDTNDDSYTQCGYISCSGGGSAWKPNIITIFNKGPGDFYIGPIQGKTDLDKIQAGNYYKYPFNNISPNIYYVSDSTNTTPNLTISV